MNDKGRYQNLPLFEAIVLKARELHLAGAIVLHGIIGFGKSSRIHQGKPFDSFFEFTSGQTGNGAIH